MKHLLLTMVLVAALLFGWGVDTRAGEPAASSFQDKSFTTQPLTMTGKREPAPESDAESWNFPAKSFTTKPFKMTGKRP